MRDLGAGFGPHIAPSGEILAALDQASAFHYSTLGSVLELVDGFTYSTSLDLGQAVYTQDPIPNLATCQGPPRAAPLQGAWNLIPGGTLCLSLLASQGAGTSWVSCKPPLSWWVLGFPLTLSLLPPSA